MGSQAVWNAEHEAPKMIAVCVNGKWHLAERDGAEQPDQTGGGAGPVVVLYRLAPGLPYRSKSAALVDGALVLKRLERE